MIARAVKGVIPSVFAATLLAGGGFGCSDETGVAGGPPLTKDELLSPESCKKCHPDHYKEWSGSMHAYAADDPLFLAMNARGQRETGGTLGDFCINCHAPMAVREGATTDGLNAAELPKHLKGVTCIYCHSVTEVTGTHNAPLTLADDGVIRGGIAEPIETGAHKSQYSSLHDRSKPESASLCGSCHDIVTPLQAHIERTFEEHKNTLFASEQTLLTCGQCHMTGRDGLAADVDGVPLRKVHAHTFEGVDTALIDFPEKDSQKALVQSSLDTTLQAELCVKVVGSAVTLEVVLDNVGAGHSFPSGAGQDRRAWVELSASLNGAVIYESGVVADGEDVLAAADPDRWVIRDCGFNEVDNPTHNFWEMASYDSNLLPGPVTNQITDPLFKLTHAHRTFPRPASMPSSLPQKPDQVTLRVRLIPVGYDILDDLIATGDLDPSFKAKMPIFTLKATEVTWTMDKAKPIPHPGVDLSCVSNGILVDPTDPSAVVPAPEHMICSP